MVDFLNIGQYQNKIATVKKNIQDVNIGLDNNSKATAKNTADTATNSTNLQNATAKLDTSTVNLRKLDEDKTNAANALDSLKEALAGAGDDEQVRKATEGQIADKEAEIKALDQEMMKAENEVANAQKEVDTLNKEKIDLQAEAQDNYTEKTQLETQKQVYETELSQIQNDLNAEKAKMAESIGKIGSDKNVDADIDAEAKAELEKNNAESMDNLAKEQREKELKELDNMIKNLGNID